MNIKYLKYSYIFFLISFFSYFNVQADSNVCNQIYIQTAISKDFKRLTITSTNQDTDPVLVIEPGSFSKNVSKAALEIKKMMMYNSSHLIDSKILGKDKIVLSMPLENGYFIDVYYIASGRMQPAG